ncbi:uncharacterized protein LOC141900092 [Tubulanus polymorphus]|uniref:uncharacterized protein LOC141900092 n=1 Tax=Tubulanus polymorphus TaxID=672921 RepID=UPI003DA2972D
MDPTTGTTGAHIWNHFSNTDVLASAGTNQPYAAGYQPGSLNEMVANLTRPNMPWNEPPLQNSFFSSSNAAMNLNGYTHNRTIPVTASGSGNSPGLAWKKRKKKTDSICSMPRKMFISEEKMAECMKNLYIDDRFKKRAAWYCTSQEEAMKIIQEIDSRLSLEDEEIEEKMENEQGRLEICEALREQMVSWPKVMNESKPCMEVVLWKCPSSVLKNLENTPKPQSAPNIVCAPVEPVHVDFKPLSVPRPVNSSAEIELSWNEEDEDNDNKMDL